MKHFFTTDLLLLYTASRRCCRSFFYSIHSPRTRRIAYD